MNVNDIREHVQPSGRPAGLREVAVSPDLGVLLSGEDEASPALPYSADLGSKPAMACGRSASA